MADLALGTRWRIIRKGSRSPYHISGRYLSLAEVEEIFVNLTSIVCWCASLVYSPDVSVFDIWDLLKYSLGKENAGGTSRNHTKVWHDGFSVN